MELKIGQCYISHHLSSFADIYDLYSVKSGSGSYGYNSIISSISVLLYLSNRLKEFPDSHMNIMYFHVVINSTEMSFLDKLRVLL
jgi:hypothetical protein